MRFRSLLPAALIAFGILPSLAAETPIKQGQSFYRARGALLRDGWRPIVTYDKDFDHDDPSNGPIDPGWPNARPFWLQGFREIEFCTGTEGNYCGFNYLKNGRCLYLLTEGEYALISDPEVSNWWIYPVPAKGKCSRDAIETPVRGRIRPGGESRSFP